MKALWIWSLGWTKKGNRLKLKLLFCGSPLGDRAKSKGVLPEGQRGTKESKMNIETCI